MSFSSLLGNEQLKKNLTRSIKNGHISHFYLISGPEGSGKHTLAKLLAAAILCQGHDKPCLSCTPCRKVRDGNHPDFITVDDPEHKTVAVKIVRAFREDVFIRPNESEYKIYLIPQELGIEGQNALLKILEEPPRYGVFILLTDNPERLLPTVRSRCTELALRPLGDSVLRHALEKEFPDISADDITGAIIRSGGFLGQAQTLLGEGAALPPQTESFVKAFAAGNALELVQTLTPMEKLKRDQLIGLLSQWLSLLESALSCRSGVAAVSEKVRDLAARRSPQDLMRAMGNLQKAIEYAQGNISPAAICGWLAWELR